MVYEKLEKLVKRIRRNSAEVGFWAILATIVFATIMSYVWTVSSGEVHTAWEVIGFIFLGIAAVSVLVLSLSGLQILVVSVKNWRNNLGKHQRAYRLVHLCRSNRDRRGS